MDREYLSKPQEFVKVIDILNSVNDRYKHEFESSIKNLQPKIDIQKVHIKKVIHKFEFAQDTEKLLGGPINNDLYEKSRKRRPKRMHGILENSGNLEEDFSKYQAKNVEGRLDQKLFENVVKHIGHFVE